MLHQAANDESSPFRNEDVVFSQLLLFLLAGFDTPSTAMGFMIHCLAMNQNIQDKLRAEIKEALAKHVS
jgi:cytochrome P450